MTTPTTPLDRWKQYGAAVKADLDRAVARNTELADQLDAAKARITELEARPAKSEEGESLRTLVPGLRRGIQDADKKVALVVNLIDERKAGTLALEKERAELLKLRARLQELEQQATAALVSSPDSDAPLADQATEEDQRGSAVDPALAQIARIDPPRNPANPSKKKDRGGKPPAKTWDDGEPRST